MKNFLIVLGIAISSASSGQITVTSNLPASISAGSSVDVEVKINKGAVGNFAKYQMDAPIGYNVAPLEIKGGNFTFENQRAKIVWVSVPSEPEFVIKFKVQALSNAAATGNFIQKFYYLENNEKKEVEALPVLVTVGGGDNLAVATTSTQTVAVTTPAVTAEPTQTQIAKTETMPAETVTNTQAKNSTPNETNNTTPPPEVKTTPAPTNKATSTADGNTVYKIQLGAYSTQPNKSKFNSVGSVSIDNVVGVYKVTTGNFKTKEEALKQRDQLQNKGFIGSFLVKFVNGQRVN